MTTLNKEHSELDHILVSLDSNPAIKKQVKANIEKLIQTSNKEARIDEINLFREAMINHSTPMIYAPDRIKQLKQEEAK